MTLFFSLLPLYLFGNFHCAGMCGPLVMLLARSPFRYHYFFGRLLSFSLAGLISAEVGYLFFLSFQRFHLAALASLALGSFIIFFGFAMLFKFHFLSAIDAKMAGLSQWLTKWILAQKAYATFLFGFFTLILPCGQTLIVFSACALNASPLEGLINGFFFALLTSPSLIAAMHAVQFFKQARTSFHLWIGCSIIFVGTLALFRGLADLEIISHLILNPHADPKYHLVLY